MALPALGADLQRLTLAGGESLYREGEPGDAMYLVEAGRIELNAAGSTGEKLSLGAVMPGESLGALQLLTAGRRTATAVAAIETTVLQLSAAQFERAVRTTPQLERTVAELASREVRRRQLAVGLRRLVGALTDDQLRTIEGMVDWIRLPRGGTLVREGDRDSDVYILVSGRLRAVRATPAGLQLLGDIAQGESVGEMVFFTGEQRTATVLATRDSTLVRFSADEFDDLLRSDYEVARRVTRLVVDRLRRVYSAQSAPEVRTIAVVPASDGVDVALFATQLVEALGRHGTACSLTATALDRELGAGSSTAGPDTPRDAGISAWFDSLEADHRFVVFAADEQELNWARRCVDRADQILLLARPDADPGPAELERLLLADEEPVTAARRSLILLHDPTTPLPAGTAAWLRARRLDAHHHFRGTAAAEFERLARFIAGRAIGVVLGGGGARGFAHIGVLQALREAGVPIDMIGGTSMGASIGAQYALGWDAREMLRRNREAWLDLEPHKEYTLPLLSILKGRKAEIMGRMLYGEHYIEDLWTNYYCVSTNLTQAEQCVHRYGSLRRAATASASLPAIVTPVVENGNLLVDGAVLNNLPIDVMRQLGAGIVLAVDVSTEEDLVYPDEAFPSPWSLLRDRLLRRRRGPVPNIGEVVLRCTMLGSVNRAAATQDMADFYIRPPLDSIGLMEFTALDESASIGRSYTLERLGEWSSTPLFGSHD